MRITQENQKPENIIASYRLNIAREFQFLDNLKIPDALVVTTLSTAPTIIKLTPADNIFFLNIQQSVLLENPCVYFTHSTGEIIAELFYRDQQCHLHVCETHCTIDVVCDLDEAESLSIISRGKIFLSGSITAQKSIHVACRECHVQDSEVHVDDTTYSCATLLKTNRLTIRAEGNVILDKKTVIKVNKQTHFFGNSIVNSASLISTQDFIFLANTFENYGAINVAGNAVGFSIDFYNHTKAKITTENLFSLYANHYIDDGCIHTNVFNLHANDAIWNGELQIQHEAQIFADVTLTFNQQASINAQGQFIAKCNGDINVHCHVMRARGALELSSEKDFNFTGYANIQDSRVMIAAKEQVNILGMFADNQQSHLVIKANNIVLKERLFNFKIIELVSNHHLQILAPAIASDTVLLSGDQVEIFAIVESKTALEIDAKTIHVNQEAFVLAGESAKIIGDILQNEGKILSKKTLELGVNYLTCNQGQVTAASLTINTSIFANLGGIHSDVFNGNALILLSIGIVQTKQSKCNAIFALNAGLTLTDLPSLNTLFTLGNLLECAKLSFKQLTPQSLQLLQMAYQAYGFLSADFSRIKQQLIDAYAEFQQLSAMQVPLYRMIAAIVKMKDTALIAKSMIQQFSGIKTLSQNALHEIKTLHVHFTQENFLKVLGAIDSVKITSNIVDLVTPLNTSDAVINVSGAITLTTHQLTRSWKMHHSAFSAALGSLSYQVLHFANQGALLAVGEIDLAGRSFRNEEMIRSAQTVHVNYNHVKLASSAAAVKNWRVSADTILVENQAVESCHMHSAEMTVNGVSTLNDSRLDGENISLLGDIRVNKSEIIATENLQQHGILDANKSVLRGNSVDLNNATLADGYVAAKEKLNAENVDAAHTAFNADDVAWQDSTLQSSSIVAENIAVARSGCYESSVHAKKTLEIASSNIERSDVRSSEISITGISQINSSKFDGKNISLFGDTRVNKSEIIASETLQQKKSLEAHQSVLQGNITNLNTATLTNSSVIAKEKLNAENVDAARTAFNAPDIVMQDSRVVAKMSLYKNELPEANQSRLHGNTLTLNNVTLNNSAVSAKKLHAKKVNAADVAFNVDNVALQNSTLTRSSIVAEHTTAAHSNCDASSVHTKKTLEMAHSTIERSDVTSNEISIAGISQINSSKFDGKNISLFGDTRVGQSGIIATENLQQSGFLEANQSVLQGKNVHLNNATLTDSSVTAKEKLNTEKVNAAHTAFNATDVVMRDAALKDRSSITAEGGDVSIAGTSEIKNSTIKSHGSLVVKDKLKTTASHFSAKNMTLSAKIDATGHVKLTVDETLTTEKSCQLSAEELYITSHVFDHRGIFNTTKGFNILSDRMYNWGTLDLNGGAQFNINQLMVNVGTIQGSNINVNAGAFVNLWHINGYDNLTVNAAVSLNVGLMRSMNIRVNALVSMNTGLYLPSLPSSTSAFFSWSNAINVTRALAYNVSPGVSNLIGAAQSIYGLCNSNGSAVNLWSGMYKVAQQFKEDPSKINFSEVIGLIAGAKDAVSTATSIMSSASDAFSEKKSNQDNASENSENENKPVPQKALSRREQLMSAGSTVMNELGPRVSTSAVFSVNGVPTDTLAKYSETAASVVKNVSGRTLAHNITEEAVWSQNHGIQEATNRYSSTTYSKENTGEIHSLEFRLKGDRYKNSGKTIAQIVNADVNHWRQINGQTQFSGGSIHAKNFAADGGSIALSATKLTVDNLTRVAQPASLSLNSGSVLKSKEADIKGSVVASGDRTKIKIAEDTSIDGGSVELSHRSAMEAEQLSVESGGNISADNSSLKIAEDTSVADGSIELSHQSSINTGQLKLESGAKILADKSSLTAGKTQSDGILSAKDSSVALIEYNASKNSETYAERSTLTTEDDMNIYGKLDSKQSTLTLGKKTTFGDDAKLRIDDTHVNAHDIQFSGQAEVHGENSFTATAQLNTDSISNMTGPGAIAFNAVEGSLDGKLTIAVAAVDIKKLNDVRSLVYGKGFYQRFQPTERLSVKTDENISFDKKLHRECALGLSAASITVDAPLSFDNELDFETTQGALQVNVDIHAKKSMHLKSATHITNRGVNVASNDVLSLETAQGDLNNIGGLFQGKNYLQGRINGNIYNTTVPTLVHDKYDTHQQYHPARISGGSRAEDNVGIYLDAEGRVINDASIIESVGHNIIRAKKGYESLAHTESYILDQQEKKGFFRGNKTVTETTDVFSSNMHSAQGRNVVISEESAIHADASSFIAKDGTDLLARDNIDLFGVKTTQKTKTDKYSLFGLTDSHARETHETIAPVIIYDTRHSNIRSSQGNIHLKNAVVLGDGKLTLRAKNIWVTSDTTDHAVSHRQRSLTVDAFGISTLRSAIVGQNSSSLLLHEDPALRKMDALCHSNNVPELLANSWNAALNAYNTYHTFHAAYMAGNMGSTILQRYGLGGSKGFDPTINLTYTDKKEELNYQSVGAGGIACSALEVIADNEFKIVGCSVDIAHDMSVTAKSFTQEGIAQSSHFNARSISVSVGVTARGEIASVGAAYQQQEDQQVTYYTEALKVGGELTVNVNQWEIDQATADVGSLAGHVDQLKIISRQNTHESHGFSCQANTNGAVAASISHLQSAKVNQRSGIQIRETSQTEQAPFTATHAELEGGGINLVDNDAVQIERITAKNIDDVEKSSSYGLSANLVEIAARQSAANNSSTLANTLPIVGVQYASHAYEARNFGLVNDGSKREKEVAVNRDTNIQLDVPVIPRKQIAETFSLPAQAEKAAEEKNSDQVGNENFAKAAPELEENTLELNIDTGENAWQPNFFLSTEKTNESSTDVALVNTISMNDAEKAIYDASNATQSTITPVSQITLFEDSKTKISDDALTLSSELFKFTFNHHYKKLIKKMRAPVIKVIDECIQESVQSCDVLSYCILQKIKMTVSVGTTFMAYAPKLFEHLQHENGDMKKASQLLGIDIGFDLIIAYSSPFKILYNASRVYDIVISSELASRAKRELQIVNKNIDREVEQLKKQAATEMDRGNRLAAVFHFHAAKSLEDDQVMEKFIVLLSSVPALPAKGMKYLKSMMFQQCCAQDSDNVANRQAAISK